MVDKKLETARKRFGAVIRERRKELGLSQEALAHECEMDRTYIGGIERGTRNPALKNILKVCKALKISAADLFKAAGL